jgi:hypothetical protein
VNQEPEPNPVRCETCIRWRRGYCSTKCERTEPTDACSAWQSAEPTKPRAELWARLKASLDAEG